MTTTNEKKIANTRGRQRSHTLQYKPQRQPTPRPPTPRPLIPQALPLFEQSSDCFQDVTEEWASKMFLDDRNKEEVNSTAK